MRKLVLIVILLTLFITKTNSQEINLNGFTFNIPSKTNFIQITNLDQIIGFNFMFGQENGKNIDINKSIDDELKGNKEMGILENDKVVMIGHKIYLEAFSDYIHDYKLLTENPDAPIFRWKILKYLRKCTHIKDELKNIECLDKTLKNHHEEFEINIIAGSKPIDELKYKAAELQSELMDEESIEQDLGEKIAEEKKSLDKMIHGKVLSYKKKYGITKSKNFYETANIISYSDFKNKKLMLSDFFIITPDGKFRMIKLTCNYKKCKKPKKLFDDIIKQFLQKEEVLIEVNLNNNEEIKKYINIVKSSYKSYKFAKYLLLLL